MGLHVSVNLKHWQIVSKLFLVREKNLIRVLGDTDIVGPVRDVRKRREPSDTAGLSNPPSVNRPILTEFRVFKAFSIHPGSIKQDVAHHLCLNYSMNRFGSSIRKLEAAWSEVSVFRSQRRWSRNTSTQGYGTGLRGCGGNACTYGTLVHALGPIVLHAH